MAGVLAGAGVDAESVRILEDPRLREVEHGTSIRPRKRNYDAHMAGSITGMMAARALQIATTELQRFWRA